MVKRRHYRRLESVDFSIDIPVANNTAPADNTGMITVQMDDNGSSDGFAARIYGFSTTGGIGAAPISGPTDFPGHNPSTNKRILSMSAGSINPSGSGNNRVVQVEDKSEGRIIGHPFEAVAGSGSIGSLQVKFCKPGQLVPVAITLRLDSKVTKGTCAKCSVLNRPTLLLHSDNVKVVGCWYSRPIALSGKAEPPAYWVLERNSATVWKLFLIQGDEEVVVFTAKTKPKDCSLPTKLKREGTGSKACKGWPNTVSILPGL